MNYLSNRDRFVYMMNQLDYVIDDFHERELPQLMFRDKVMPWLAGKAQVVTGMRRAGKTWFCFQQMQELMAGGLEKERILYLNFEDERFLPFISQEFQLFLDTYFRKYPLSKDRDCYLFLDEVQRIEGWDLFVRRVLDTEPFRVCITGSSSRLLSTEIATSLRGRSVTTEIFPFSFSEFLRFQDKHPGSGKRFGSKMRAVLQSEMGRYLETGGFPEVQRLEASLRHQVLGNYIDVVILRDVVERHAVSNTQALRALIRHVMSAPATRFSVNKFYNTLRSRGITCTKNKLYAYLDHLSDAFLFYAVPLHSRSEKARQVNPKKIYVVDTGLLQAMSFYMTGDRGALLENLVYMQLRRQGRTPEYYVTGKGAEIDFVIDEPDESGRRTLIQVCWDVSDPQTRAREVWSLLDAMEELKAAKGIIVTWLDEDRSDDRYEIVPAWKWFLD